MRVFILVSFFFFFFLVESNLFGKFVIENILYGVSNYYYLLFFFFYLDNFLYHICDTYTRFRNRVS